MCYLCSIKRTVLIKNMCVFTTIMISICNLQMGMGSWLCARDAVVKIVRTFIKQCTTVVLYFFSALQEASDRHIFATRKKF